MPDLSAADRRKMAGILGRLQSDQVGEVIAAAHLASALLRKAGVTWQDLLAPAPSSSAGNGGNWRGMVAACLEYPGLLSEWEKRFLSELWRRPAVTPRQQQKLSQIAQQLQERKAW
jgi:hypothetical protein